MYTCICRRFVIVISNHNIMSNLKHELIHGQYCIYMYMYTVYLELQCCVLRD